MYIKKNYGFWMTFNWSRKPFIYGLIYTLIVSGVSYYFDFNVMLPWAPIGVIGIAVAFYLGFKNNSAYDRTWEARKIWGGIVNDSRTFSAAVVSFIQGERSDEVKKELIYRHIAWLTALRFQLRLERPWEHKENRLNNKYIPVVCESYLDKLDQELRNYLNEDELKSLLTASNQATQIMRNQSKRLQQLRDDGYIEDFRHMALHNQIRLFYDHQGKSERIKNFPFPRQYASTALWMTYVFSFFVPFGLLDIYQDVHTWTFWTFPFVGATIIWVFFLMEKIGDYSENPFEGTYNDVPITSIAKGIEIDIREMIHDTDIPSGVEPDENGFVM